MKELIRTLNNEIPEQAEVLSTSEFITVVMEQISNTAKRINEIDDDVYIVEELSDILELMNEYLKAKNINPVMLFNKVNELRKEEGTFEKKVAVNQE